MSYIHNQFPTHTRTQPRAHTRKYTNIPTHTYTYIPQQQREDGRIVVIDGGSQPRIQLYTRTVRESVCVLTLTLLTLTVTLKP